MDLDEYLWRTKTKQVVFARRTKIATVTMSNLVRKQNTPSLIHALNIVRQAEGKVTLEELIRPSELHHLVPEPKEEETGEPYVPQDRNSKARDFSIHK